MEGGRIHHNGLQQKNAKNAQLMKNWKTHHNCGFQQKNTKNSQSMEDWRTNHYCGFQQKNTKNAQLMEDWRTHHNCGFQQKNPKNAQLMEDWRTHCNSGFQQKNPKDLQLMEDWRTHHNCGFQQKNPKNAQSMEDWKTYHNGYRQKDSKQAQWIDDCRNDSNGNLKCYSGFQWIHNCGKLQWLRRETTVTAHCRHHDRIMSLCDEGRWKEAVEMADLLIIEQCTWCSCVDTYVQLLRECSRMAALAEGKRIHAHILLLLTSEGLGAHIFVRNTLLNMYTKCGSLRNAHALFNRMPERNVVSWTILILGYTNEGQGGEALLLFRDLQEGGSGVKPNEVTFTSILKACASLGSLEEGKWVHASIVKDGLAMNRFVGSALIDMYVKCGRLGDARRVFDGICVRDVVLWNAMIGGYVHWGCGEEALSLFEQMRVKPNKVTFASVIAACVKCQNRSVDDARRVFDHAALSECDTVIWNLMIDGYTQSGRVNEALALFERMQIENFVEPNAATFVCTLKACAGLPSLAYGKCVHACIEKSEALEINIILQNSLIDMYSKCGSVGDAQRVFNRMRCRDTASWNVMITGYAKHGCGKECLAMFEKMQERKEGRVKPDNTTFVSVLSACSQQGLANEAVRVFDSMRRDHAITPTPEHYSCMVNLLGRLGYLADAEVFIKKMPIPPTLTIWKALLSSCKTHAHNAVPFKL